MNRAELIAKLEQATGPGRELDLRVTNALRSNPKLHYTLEELAVVDGQPEWRSMIPPYTESLDAALTLVPDGWIWHVWSVSDGMPSAELRKDGTFPIFGHPSNQCKTRGAIGLCIAALRARAQDKQP